MIYCPKYETWIFREECDKDDECYQLENWWVCVILSREVKKMEEEELRKIEEASECPK